MAAVRRLLFILMILPAVYLAAQSGSNETIFTISVAAPTSPKDVQIRPYLVDEAGVRWTSIETHGRDNKLVIRANTSGATPKTFKAIAYAPGCQLVTFSVDDLASGTRQGEFACQKLPTVQLHGTTALPPGGQALDVEAMYVVRWAAKFFGSPAMSISPLVVGKAPVQSDGSLAIELPDFANDPLWNSVAKDATLMFFLVDSKTGDRVATLKAPASLSRGGDLKVAASYPDVAFTIRQNRVARSAKATH
jgi:hypothetical protein